MSEINRAEYGAPAFAVYFWAPMLSPHTSALFEEIAAHISVRRVEVIVEEELPTTFLERGWEKPSSSNLRITVKPSYKDIDRIVEQSAADSVHVFCGIRRVPTVVTGLRAVKKHSRYYGLMSEPRVSDGVRGAARFFQSWLSESKVRKHAGFVFAIGRHGPRWFRTTGYRSDRIFPFAYFIERSLDYRPRKDASGVIYLGRLEKEKGFDVFCLAAERLGPDVQVQIVGDGSLRGLALRHASERSNWKYHGTLAMSSVPSILRSAAVLCAPSRSTNDGWCVAISEGLLNGCSVVTTSKTGASICLEQREILGRVVDPNDPDATYRALKELTCDPLTMETASKRSDWANKNLTAAAGAKYFVDVLRYLRANGDLPKANWLPNKDQRWARVESARLAFVWDNFGPLHDDRVSSVASDLPGQVLGIELCGSSDTYGWDQNAVHDYDKVTLFKRNTLRDLNPVALYFGLCYELIKRRVNHVFFSHYDNIGILLSCVTMKLIGAKCYVISCSKFDDKPRFTLQEFLKGFFLFPYDGALCGSPRTVQYMSFLGIPPDRQRIGANTVSVSRIRRLASGADIEQFTHKDFVVVARLVQKKNISGAIRAFRDYLSLSNNEHRNLRILGDGPLRDDLEQLVESLGIQHRVIFEGLVQSDSVARALANAVALVLVSHEEQFGNVVPEALSLGIPIILSDICGARDELVKTHINGYVLKPDNIVGIARAMWDISSREDRWLEMSRNSSGLAILGDVKRFSESAISLIG